MKITENEATTTAPSNTDDSTNGSGYEAVRYNALQHGILSRLVVLPHENSEEYSNLLASLFEEHNPSGITERTLIEELAAIIWRKRRILLAEGATINRGLKSMIDNVLDSPIPAAVPFARGLSKKNTDLLDLMTCSQEEIVERRQYADEDLAATRKAQEILRKGGVAAYDKARKALIPDSRDWWDENVEDKEYPATAEGLQIFIREQLEPICIQMAQEARYAHEIKIQALGEGLQAYRLEKLNRYEIHLDRKFERTLAMLLKMQELRINK